MISSLQPSVQVPHVLALDLGLRFGWACYRQDGQLIAYGSHHCGQPNKLKAVAFHALRSLPAGSSLVVEGGGALLKHWSKFATKFEHQMINIHAEQWRKDCLSISCLTNGKKAKAESISLASSLIRSRTGRGAISLRHDTAEACLIGWWALYHLGYLEENRFRSQLKN